MSNVTLSIQGRQFTVACAEGEERHLQMLGRMINEKLAAMGDMGGQSETRMLLFGLLFMADELHELRGKSSGADSTVAPAQLEAIAVKLENLASRLEA